MRLAPRDMEKLLLHTACVVAQKRYARGLKLNYPEAMALLAGQLLELVRDGHSLAQLAQLGTRILGTDDVMTGVVEMIEEVQVEGTLVDGTKLVSIQNPIRYQGLDSQLALYGSGLIKTDALMKPDNSMELIPGASEIEQTPIVLNEGRDTVSMEVTNSGNRSVQVGSHCNFAEVNRALLFDRLLAVGFRLDIPAGTAVRFEPGEIKQVSLVAIGGEKRIYGGNNLIQGSYEERTQAIEEVMKAKQFIQ
ncbi:MAG: urease subunit beta [Phocaeicola sp.]